MEVTAEQFEQLRREVQETKWLTFAWLQCWYGKEKADELRRNVLDWMDSPAARFATGTPVYEVAWQAAEPLMEADLFTLEDVAALPREEVASIPGVGRVKLRQLEEAMGERGLSFAGVS